MKVLHINDKTTISGGVEVYIRDVMPLLNANGIQTRWVATGVKNGKAWVKSEDGTWDWQGRSITLDGSPLSAWIDADTVIHVHSLSAPKVLEQLFQMGPVVRHMHEPRMICPGQGKFWASSETACTRPFGYHCLVHAYTQHCCNRHPKRLLSQFSNTRYELRVAAPKYSAILANSNWMRDQAIRAGYSEASIRLLHYFTKPKNQTQPAERPRVLYTGRLSHTKGVHYLLQSMAIVLHSVPEARLDLLGGGHSEASLKSLSQELEISEAVKFHGWANEKKIDKHLSSASLLAFPSIYPEAFGISGIEAMMHGRPVVGFDVGGVSDWLKNGLTGIAVPSKDVNALAEGMIALLTNKQLRKRYGDAARKAAIDRFSKDAHIARLVPTYRCCLNRSKR